MKQLHQARTKIALLALTSTVSFSVSAAQPAYPAKPVRMIVAQTAGGTGDIVARAFAQKFTEQLGQQVVIDNRAGAGGVIATELVARAPADGYTLLVVTTALAINPNFVADLPFDTRRDLTPISLLAAGYHLLVVSPKNSAHTVKDLIAEAKAQPGKLNFSSSGTAGAAHLTGELFKLLAGINVQHVPYKGSPAALTAVIGGEADFSFGSMASTLTQVRSGRLRALAISSAKRSDAAPEIPTVAEAGVPGFESSAWQALLGPAKMSPALVEQLYRVVETASKNPDLQKRMSTEGMATLGSTPKELDTHIARELDKWAKVTKAAGISVR